MYSDSDDGCTYLQGLEEERKIIELKKECINKKIEYSESTDCLEEKSKRYSNLWKYIIDQDIIDILEDTGHKDMIYNILQKRIEDEDKPEVIYEEYLYGKCILLIIRQNEIINDHRRIIHKLRRGEKVKLNCDTAFEDTHQ
jgi:hypothetical protein